MKKGILLTLLMMAFAATAQESVLLRLNYNNSKTTPYCYIRYGVVYL